MSNNKMDAYNGERLHDSILKSIDNMVCVIGKPSEHDELELLFLIFNGNLFFEHFPDYIKNSLILEDIADFVLQKFSYMFDKDVVDYIVSRSFSKGIRDRRLDVLTYVFLERLKKQLDYFVCLYESGEDSWGMSEKEYEILLMCIYQYQTIQSYPTKLIHEIDVFRLRRKYSNVIWKLNKSMYNKDRKEDVPLNAELVSENKESNSVETNDATRSISSSKFDYVDVILLITFVTIFLGIFLRFIKLILGWIY